MSFPLRTHMCCAAATGLLAGCSSSPFDLPRDTSRLTSPSSSSDEGRAPPSAFRDDEPSPPPELSDSSSPDDYVRHALFNNPEVEAAYQLWRAAAERLPQVAALPDPRLNFGYFVEEVQTRTGPQDARVGLQQTIPWPGTLRNREDAASRAAMAAWWRFEASRLTVSERVVSALHELAYLDAAVRITEQQLALLRSFEEVVRARYRVGTGSHPELIRVQVELGQLEDRLAQLTAMRPSYAAELNAALNRDASAPIPPIHPLPGLIAGPSVDELTDLARSANPLLLALDEQAEQQRSLAKVARNAGLPDLTVGLDYIFTGDAINPATPGSGDDPVLLSFGINLPLWRDKYDAGVRQSVAQRLALAHQRTGQANRIAANIHRAWFEHMDADRRVRLYESTLIPKSEESLRASLAGFRAGETNFLDLIDTERTLLEFAVAAERARADRGEALARLHSLVGAPIPTRAADTAQETEPQP